MSTLRSSKVPAIHIVRAAKHIYAEPAWWLLVIFSFSIPAEAALIIPGFGSLSRAIGVVLMGVVALDVLTRVNDVRPNVVSLVVAAFVIWAGFSVLWSLGPEISLQRSVTYLQLAIMFWIIIGYADSEERCLILLRAYCLGVLLAAITTIIEFRAINFLALASTDVRVSAFGVNPNEHGLTMVAGLAWGLYFCRSANSMAGRLLFVAVLLLGAVSVVLTASRGAFAVLALSGAGFLWMLNDARLAVRIFWWLLLGAIVLTVIVMIPDAILERLETIVRKLQSLDFNNRMAAWEAGLRYFKDSPVGGVGAGAFIEATVRVISIPRSSHNTFLGVLVELGIVGASLFLAIVCTALRSAWQLKPAWRRAALVTLLPMFVGMMVTGWDHRKVPWFFFAVIIALAACQRTAPSARN